MDFTSKTAAEPLPDVKPYHRWVSLGIRVLSIAVLILLFIWVYYEEGGLDWNEKSSKFFNLHPFFMILSIPICLTNGILSWRDLPFSHALNKTIHVSFNALSSAFIVLGLYITFAANRAPHCVTLHSWAALAMVGLLAIQLVGGIIFFLFPVFPLSIRARFLPRHALLGITVFLFAIFVVLTGLVQWFAYNNVRYTSMIYI